MPSVLSADPYYSPLATRGFVNEKNLLNTKVSILPSAASTPLPTSREYLEGLGAGVTREVGRVTEKIIAKASVGSFDGLGRLLVQVQEEAGKLDPSKYSGKKPGWLAWLSSKVSDVKQELTLQLKSADQVFAKLETEIANHIAVHTEWVKDLEALYLENYQQCLQVIEVLRKISEYEEYLKARLQAWPAIDPEDIQAAIKIQERLDVENLLQQALVKKDHFLRSKVLAESNAPRIRDQQNTSRQTIATLTGIIEQTIPIIKAEFARFLQTLDAQNSIQVIDSARNLTNTALITGADNAKAAAIKNAEAFNRASISTETLDHIRARMIETVTAVREIENTAATQRQLDVEHLQKSQAQYLKSCTAQGIL